MKQFKQASAFESPVLKRWRAFARTLLLATGAAFGLVAVGLLVLDPYDTGRIGLLKADGLPNQSPNLANASRGRDHRFNAAIFGNSHVQALQPQRLSALTGMSFVSLMLPGTRPVDQLTLLRWFISRHPSPPKAIVIGMDRLWCSLDVRATQQVPAWLYAQNPLRYAAGLIRYRSIEAAVARVRFLSTGKERARPDGFWDYGPFYERYRRENPVAAMQRLYSRAPVPINETDVYPAIESLGDTLKSLPLSTKVLLLRPPLFGESLPAPNTPESVSDRNCLASLLALVRMRRNILVLDWMVVRAETMVRSNFYDPDHYTDDIARIIEREIAHSFAIPLER